MSTSFPSSTPELLPMDLLEIIFQPAQANRMADKKMATNMLVFMMFCATVPKSAHVQFTPLHGTIRSGTPAASAMLGTSASPTTIPTKRFMPAL